MSPKEPYLPAVASPINLNSPFAKRKLENSVIKSGKKPVRIPGSGLRGCSAFWRQNRARRRVLNTAVLKQGMLKMNPKPRPVRLRERRLSGNEQVRREIQNFLHALHSYPDRFVRNPDITFEQHHVRLVRAASAASRRRF
jgi:hypothetical protein